MSRVGIQRAVKAIQKYYPMRLADASWDNTGLLVESFSDNERKLKILLTIDLTQSVVEEAIQSQSNLIMAYHPFIFRGLKSITTNDPQQQSLLKLIKHEISVYSPHTAVDSAIGGVNDYLVDGICSPDELESKTSIIPNTSEPEGCGMGRLIVLKNAIKLSTMVEKVKQSLNLDHVQVAIGNGQSEHHPIKSIAICAGSGGSVFKGVNADLYYTGELSHHEALFFKESGSSIIVCNHSNTERAFLTVFKQQLQQELPDAEVLISDTDKDPFQTW